MDRRELPLYDRVMMRMAQRAHQKEIALGPVMRRAVREVYEANRYFGVLTAPTHDGVIARYVYSRC